MINILHWWKSIHGNPKFESALKCLRGFPQNLLDTEQRDTFVWERSIAADSDSNCLATAAAASR